MGFGVADVVWICCVYLLFVVWGLLVVLFGGWLVCINCIGAGGWLFVWALVCWFIVVVIVFYCAVCWLRCVLVCCYFMVCGYVNLVAVVCVAGFGVLFYMFGVAVVVC